MPKLHWWSINSSAGCGLSPSILKGRGVLQIVISKNGIVMIMPPQVIAMTTQEEEAIKKPRHCDDDAGGRSNLTIRI